MEIKYNGANCVVLQTKANTVVVDPTANTGVKDFGPSAIILWTDERLAQGAALQTGFVIDMPGEFEHGEVSVKGVAAQRHTDPDGRNSTVYKLEIAGVRVVVLGHILAPLAEDELEQIGVVDIAIVPVGGGGYTLDAKDAANVVKQLDPRVVVPTHFADGVAYEVPQEKLELFVKELGRAKESLGHSVKLKNVEQLPASLTIYELSRK